MKKSSKKSEMVVKNIFLPMIVGAACVWLLTLLWNFSEVGMMRKTLEAVKHEPEKVYVEFPENNIFGVRIFYESEIKCVTTSGGPIYLQEVNFEQFQKLVGGEVYAVSSHKVIDRRLKITLTGSSVDGVMLYKTVIKREFDIPKGKRVVGLRHIDGKLEISQQTDLGLVSWHLVVERLIYLVVLIVVLVFLLQEFLDKKSAEENAKYYNGEFREQSKRAEALADELKELKKHQGG